MKIKLRKGLNINIEGALAEGSQPVDKIPEVCAITPDDFPGFTPKPAVKEGDKVAKGSPLLFDKNHPDVKLVSPVAGTVRAIVRGERRKILRIEVTAEGTDAVAFRAPDTAEEARAFMAATGLLSACRQRPYAIVPDPAAEVRDIFVTAFDAAPLAYPLAETVKRLYSAEDLAAGVKVLTKITSGKVYISHDKTWPFSSIPGAEMVEIAGAYPASNPGIQAGNISPVDKGDTIWTLDVVTLARIGATARTGQITTDTLVAVVGPEVKSPMLVKTIDGAAVAPLIEGNIDHADRHHRIISGNVFTGTAVGTDGYLHAPYRQVTVIAEGDDVDEFMGWVSMSPAKMSQTRTMPGHFLHRLFRPDARLNGGRRAMIMSGQYEKYMPVDIMPEYLIKAILAKNIEDMEKLGIYEVAPEDFAAAEYADTSKLPLQQIVRDGLDYLRKELE